MLERFEVRADQRMQKAWTENFFHFFRLFFIFWLSSLASTHRARATDDETS